jgi:hypothetical protein
MLGKVIFTVLLLVAGVLTQTSLYPEYSPTMPIQYTAGSTYNLQMSLCSTPNIYKGCEFSGFMNLPFDYWNVDAGIFTTYSIVGGPNCNTVLCSNDFQSTTSPQSCSFYFPGNLPPTLYLISKGGPTASLSATFNLKINCSAQGQSNFTTYANGCPTDAHPSRQDVRLDTPGAVLTSATTPVIYSFSICPTGTSYSAFVYQLAAVDKFSAFASYICDTAPCNAFAGKWTDTSASAFNYVTASGLTSETLYVAIYGWGNHNVQNNFVFNVQIISNNGGSSSLYLNATH